MVTCPNCRTEAEAGARYCGTCGRKLEEAPSRGPAQEQQNTPAAASSQPQSQPQYSQTYQQAQAPREPQPQYQQPPPPQYQRSEAPRYPQSPPQSPQYSQQYPQYPGYQPYPPYHYGPVKSPGVAAVLALVLGIFGLMGIGHLYVGKLTRGIILLVVGLVLAGITSATIVLGFASPILWAVSLIAGIAWLLLLIWQTYDAYRLANEYNFATQRSGRPAW